MADLNMPSRSASPVTENSTAGSIPDSSVNRRRRRKAEALQRQTAYIALSKDDEQPRDQTRKGRESSSPKRSKKTHDISQSDEGEPTGDFLGYQPIFEEPNHADKCNAKPVRGRKTLPQKKSKQNMSWPNHMVPPVGPWNMPFPNNGNAYPAVNAYGSWPYWHNYYQEDSDQAMNDTDSSNGEMASSDEEAHTITCLSKEPASAPIMPKPNSGVDLGKYVEALAADSDAGTKVSEPLSKLLDLVWNKPHQENIK